MDVHVADPMHNLLHCYRSHFIHEPFGKWQEWLEKEDDMYCRKGYSIPLVIKKSSSLRSPFGEHSHGTQIYSLYLPIQRSLSTYLFLRLYCHQFSIHVTFKSLPMQPNHWPQNMNYRRLVPLTIFPSKQNEQQSALLEVLPTGRISLHHCPSGISQKGAVVLQLSTFE